MGAAGVRVGGLVVEEVTWEETAAELVEAAMEALEGCVVEL